MTDIVEQARIELEGFDYILPNLGAKLCDEIERLRDALAPFAEAAQRGMKVKLELKGSTVLNHVEVYGIAVRTASNGTSFAAWCRAYEVIEQSPIKREGESE